MSHEQCVEAVTVALSTTAFYILKHRIFTGMSEASFL